MKEVMNTSSKYCKILINNGTKYILKYNRKVNDITEYPRFTPEAEILKLINAKYKNVPKVMKQSKNTFLEEFIEGKLLANIFKDHESIEKEIINQIIKEMFFLTNIDASNLRKYIKWHNNKEFYLYQHSNTLQVFNKYYENLKEIYDKLDLSPNTLKQLNLLASNLDNLRPLFLIHGDRHKKNAILKENKQLVFIDWELGGIGDLSYDIAFHLHQMAYTKEDEKYFLEKLKEEYQGDYKRLLNDIKIYQLFVLVRSTIYHVYWTDLIYQTESDEEKKKQLGHFMRRYNKLCTHKEFHLKSKNEKELDQIFKKSEKNEVISK